MMKFLADVTRPYGIKTIISLDPIMVDGTGMCGGPPRHRRRRDEVCLR